MTDPTVLIKSTQKLPDIIDFLDKEFAVYIAKMRNAKALIDAELKITYNVESHIKFSLTKENVQLFGAMIHYRDESDVNEYEKHNVTSLILYKIIYKGKTIKFTDGYFANPSNIITKEINKVCKIMENPDFAELHYSVSPRKNPAIERKYKKISNDQIPSVLRPLFDRIECAFTSEFKGKFDTIYYRGEECSGHYDYKFYCPQIRAGVYFFYWLGCDEEVTVDKIEIGDTIIDCTIESATVECVYSVCESMVQTMRDCKNIIKQGGVEYIKRGSSRCESSHTTTRAAALVPLCG